MADQHRGQFMKRRYQATVEDDLEDEYHPATESRTKRQKSNIASSERQEMSSNVPSQNHRQTVDRVEGPLLESQPSQDVAAPVAGKSLRFRGSCLGIIGDFYPDADVHVHRIGDPDPASTDFTVRGRTLSLVRSLTRENQAIYRVTLKDCDVPSQSCIGWARNSLRDQGFTADEFCNLLELGRDRVGKMIMVTVHNDGHAAWNVMRQITGKHYTLQDCLDLLEVPPHMRRELREFGNKQWINGTAMPTFWICKDLSLNNVANKIRNVMRQ